MSLPGIIISTSALAGVSIRIPSAVFACNLVSWLSSEWCLGAKVDEHVIALFGRRGPLDGHSVRRTQSRHPDLRQMEGAYSMYLCIDVCADVSMGYMQRLTQYDVVIMVYGCFFRRRLLLITCLRTGCKLLRSRSAW